MENKLKNLRVGLLNDSFPPVLDGVSNAVLNYAKYLDALCSKVFVATPYYPNYKDNYPYKVIRYSSIDGGEKIGYRIGNPFSPNALNKILKEKPSLMHVHSPFSAAVLARFARQYAKCPIVFTYHTKFDIDLEKRVGLAGIRNVSKKFILNNIHAADEVWAVSQGAGENLQNLGYNGTFIVMENGTDFEKRRSNEYTIKALKTYYKIDEEEIVFLFVGRMMWYKNIGFTIDALANLKSLGYPFKMLFIGEGQDRKALEKYVAEKGLQDQCIFTGAIRDREKLRDHFSMGDLFLFPSTYDTNGLVVREAAACNLPSLVIKGSCAAESTTYPNSAVVIEEKLDAYVEALVHATKNREQLKIIGQNAADHVYLSWEDAVAKAYHRYKTILNL